MSSARCKPACGPLSDAACWRVRAAEVLRRVEREEGVCPLCGCRVYPRTDPAEPYRGHAGDCCLYRLIRFAAEFERELARATGEAVPSRPREEVRCRE